MGLEPTPDEFVAGMVEVFREVRRVLRDDGTLWLNIGDSYANDGKWGGHTGGKHVKALHCSPIGRQKRYTGLKPKDLIGIPWMLAFALRADGWFLRKDIIWHKLNPMPESVPGPLPARGSIRHARRRPAISGYSGACRGGPRLLSRPRPAAT
jgi:DNA modification methylase